MRPYGMKGLAALALITGVAFATSPLSNEVSRVARNFLPSASQALLASAELASGGGMAYESTDALAGEEPSCALIARPDRIAYGGSTILEWQTEGAQLAGIGGVGEVPLRGTRIVNGLTVSETFTLSVKGNDTTAFCSARVEVHKPLDTPTCLISAHPSLVRAGETVQISWGAEGASSAYLTDFGHVEARGGRTIAADRSQEYVLTVFSPLQQTNTCAASITVI